MNQPPTQSKKHLPDLAMAAVFVVFVVAQWIIAFSVGCAEWDFPKYFALYPFAWRCQEAIFFLTPILPFLGSLAVILINVFTRRHPRLWYAVSIMGALYFGLLGFSVLMVYIGFRFGGMPIM